MNLFILDLDPFLAGRNLCDKHVVKMGLEAVQILCTVEHQRGGGRDVGLPLYRSTHQNHPCVRWTASGPNEWWWTAKHAIAVFSEYRVRYGRTHASENLLLAIYKAGCPFSPGKLGEVTPSRFVQAMPAMYQGSDPVEAYRAYYRGEKTHFAKWERPGAETPSWFYKTT